MIVAVTGGTGFIGRHLIARHHARGDQVRYLTRKLPREPLAGAAAFVGNLTSSVTELREFVRGVNILYHCAAELRDESQMHDTNVVGTANLLAASVGVVGRWVQLSSTGVFGRDASRNTGSDVDENSAVRPANAYESSKAEADSLVLAAAQAQTLPCVLVRPSNVYGPDMPNQSLFQLIKAIDRRLFFFIGPPGAVANYVHVENVVNALILCATAPLPENGRTFIISDHCTMEELVNVISTSLGKSPPRLRLPESLVRLFSTIAGVIPRFPLTTSRVNALTGRTTFRSDRLRRELGYEHSVSIETGIGELTQAWKSRTTDA